MAYVGADDEEDTVVDMDLEQADSCSYMMISSCGYPSVSISEVSGSVEDSVEIIINEYAMTIDMFDDLEDKAADFLTFPEYAALIAVAAAGDTTGWPGYMMLPDFDYATYFDMDDLDVDQTDPDQLIGSYKTSATGVSTHLGYLTDYTTAYLEYEEDAIDYIKDM